MGCWWLVVLYGCVGDGCGVGGGRALVSGFLFGWVGCSRLLIRFSGGIRVWWMGGGEGACDGVWWDVLDGCDGGWVSGFNGGVSW